MPMHFARSHSVCKRAFLRLSRRLAEVREEDLEAETASLVAGETAASSDTSIHNCKGLETVAVDRPTCRLAGRNHQGFSTGSNSNVEAANRPLAICPVTFALRTTVHKPSDAWASPPRSVILNPSTK